MTPPFGFPRDLATREPAVVGSGVKLCWLVIPGIHRGSAKPNLQGMQSDGRPPPGAKVFQQLSLTDGGNRSMASLCALRFTPMIGISSAGLTCLPYHIGGSM